MKIKIILILLAYFLSGCAKKTHILDSSKASVKITTANNGSEKNKKQTVDKSIIITFKDIDTNIITIGKSLTGYIGINDVNTHFVLMFSYGSFYQAIVKVNLICSCKGNVRA